MHIRQRAWLVLALLFIVSLPAITPRLYASDEIEYFSYLRSLWFDHDVSFDNEYRHFFDAGLAHTSDFHETFLERTTPTGRRYNFGTMGCAILWAPFYAVGDLAAHALAAAGRTVETDGYSRPYVIAVAFGSAFYGWLAILLSLHALRMVMGLGRNGSRGMLPGLATWFGTPLVFYMYVAPGFSHAVSAFSVAAFVVAWLHVRRRWSIAGVASLGALAALMAMVREQDAFFAGGVALDFALTCLARVRGRDDATAAPGPARLALSAAVGTLTFAAVFLPQALAYLALNGRIGPSDVVARKMTWIAPYALDVVVSPQYGFFFWTPLAVLALAGLILLAIRGGRAPVGQDCNLEPGASDVRRIAISLLVMVLLQVYINGSIRSWTVAGAFGQRRFVALTIVIVIGLGALLSRARSGFARIAATVALVVCVWWNLAMMVEFGSGMMDRQRLDIGSNAYNAFIVVPRQLPVLGYRYLFHRDSFYKWGR